MCVLLEYFRLNAILLSVNVLTCTQYKCSEVKYLCKCSIAYRQTIHHIPNVQSLFGRQVTGTFQIGDPSVIANECGVTTVGDFRLADMSVGGQGAPLVPYLDRILLKRYYQETGTVSMFLNIGGISNITVYLPLGKSSNKCPSVIRFFQRAR